MTNIRKLIIIPAFNESDSILALIDEIKLKAPDFDYIIIDDGSTDNTFELCMQNSLNAIRLPVNLGIGGAVQTGYLYAKRKGYDIAVQLDGDGQHDPDYLNELIAPIIENKADCTVGGRYINKQGFQSSKMRQFGIQWLSFFIRLTCGAKVADVTSGFRASNTKVINSFCEYYPHDYPEPEAICFLFKQGFKLKEVAVKMRERRVGKSSIRLLRPAYYMLKVTLAILISSLQKQKASKGES